MSGLLEVAQGWRSRLARPAVGPVGIHLGMQRIDLMQMEGFGRDGFIRATASESVPAGRDALLADPRALRQILKRLLSSAPFRGRRVVACLPSDDLKLMVLNFERDSLRSESEVVLDLVRERMGADLDDSVIDYLPIRTSGPASGERSALVAVARREAAVQLLDSLRGAGLRVESLEIGPVATRRLVAWLADDTSGENALVIDFGERHSDLTSMWGRRLILYRELDFGEQPALEVVSTALDVTPGEAASILETYGVSTDVSMHDVDARPPSDPNVARAVSEILKPSFEALADQATKAIVYTASKTRGAEVDHLYILGALTRWPGVDKMLEGLLRIPVRGLDPWTRVSWRPPHRASRAGEGTRGLTIAAGLALRGLVDWKEEPNGKAGRTDSDG